MSEDDTLDTFGRFWPEARTLRTAQQPFDPSRRGQDTVSLQYPMEQRRVGARREKRTWPARRRLLYAREAGRSRAREREVALGASHARVHVKITCMRVLAKCQLLFFFPLLIFFLGLTSWRIHGRARIAIVTVRPIKYKGLSVREREVSGRWTLARRS